MQSIHHRYFFPHPPETVWQYLTRADLMAQWLMENNFEPVIGHQFQFRTKPLPILNLDGIFHCQVLEMIPLKKLSYSWKGGPGPGSFTLDTLVVWALQPQQGGTLLTLEHSGFKEIENLDIYTGMTKGWLQNIEKIAARINDKQHDATGV